VFVGAVVTLGDASQADQTMRGGSRAELKISFLLAHMIDYIAETSRFGKNREWK